MTPTMQTGFYESGSGDGGNCFQAAVASIFGLPLTEVPDFLANRDEFQNSYIRFVLGRGYTILSLDLEIVKDVDAYYLALGLSERGCGHAVVYRKGRLAHDPHPSGAGLISVDLVHLFIPIDSQKLKKAEESR